MFRIIFLLSFLPSFMRCVIKVAYRKELNFAADENSEIKIFVLGQNDYIGNKKNFFLHELLIPHFPFFPHLAHSCF